MTYHLTIFEHNEQTFHPARITKTKRKSKKHFSTNKGEVGVTVRGRDVNLVIGLSFIIPGLDVGCQLFNMDV